MIKKIKIIHNSWKLPSSEGPTEFVKVWMFLCEVESLTSSP